MNIDRRKVLLGLGSAALAGCSTTATAPDAAPTSVIYQILEAYRALDRAKNQYPVSRADIDAQPLGVLGVQVEDGTKGFVVWKKRVDGLDYWHASNRVEIVTQSGRLIRTTGFPQDQLDSRIIQGVEPLGTVLDPSQSYQVKRQLDYREDPQSFEAEYTLRYVRDVEVPVLGQTLLLAEWRETVRLPQSRRQWKQLIQVGRSSGAVMRSIQHVGPKTRVILELLKPPAP